MNQPCWFSSNEIKLSNEEKNIVLDFCNLFNLFCECGKKPKKYSKYCILCFNILRCQEESRVQISKNEIIMVKTILMYHKYIKE